MTSQTITITARDATRIAAWLLKLAQSADHAAEADALIAVATMLIANKRAQRSPVRIAASD